MIKSKTLINLVTILVLGVAGVLCYRMWQVRPSQEESLSELPVTPAQIPATQPGAATQTPVKESVPLAATRPVIAAAVVDFARRWQEADTGLQGTARDAKLRSITTDAVTRFGAGPELLAYLNFLAASGAVTERQWLLTEGLGSLFSGPAAKEARTWLLTAGDEKLREQLCRQAGRMFEGPGFTEYFEAMGVAAGLHCQASLLTGYCVTMAKSDPESALRVYKELAYPKRIDNTGMAHVMLVFPADSDFPKFASEIKEDSMTLAKRARASLLTAWAMTKPEDAAGYVMGNPAKVHADQMAVVVKQWAQSSPDAAAEWLTQAPTSPARDQGMVGLARYWQIKNPQKAWDFVKLVADPQTRRAIAARVVFEWRKSDPTAADSAWAALPRE
ncbi:MAG: hypothetical protein CFE26_03200 [Verrucomicrobiales bacterium VVV1]|nr:MAG: hypothetical protein CFE26_03200 [Verrucomicrobiales bacterium VVV1]